MMLFYLFLFILGLKSVYDLFLLMQNDNLEINGNRQAVTVLVCFRNEEGNLSNLVKALSLQNYPKELMQFILVDDGSTDNSYQLAEKELLESVMSYQLLHLNLSDGNGKKAALRYGLKFVQTEWVLCTDADCVPSENWASSMMERIGPNVGMVLGGVFYQKGGFLQQLLSAEQHALMLLTKGSALANHAVLANGASTLFRKRLYPTVDNNLATGDDIFLLENIKKLNYQIVPQRFSKKNIVITEAKNSLLEIIAQRQRWASKNRKIRDKHMLFIGLLQISSHVSVCCLIVMSIYSQNLLYVIPVIFMWLIEYHGVQSLDKKLNLLPNKLATGLMIMIYSWFLLALGLLSFRRKYRWKSRIWTS
ncbi:MAG: biofilm PGA synthesis N-glycosyltransferase PgaC [Flavobacteriales bacterium]|jgi:biofilm PGA synthesis N-glycosyltransferase PgaC